MVSVVNVTVLAKLFWNSKYLNLPVYQAFIYVLVLKIKNSP